MAIILPLKKRKILSHITYVIVWSTNEGSNIYLLISETKAFRKGRPGFLFCCFAFFTFCLSDTILTSGEVFRRNEIAAPLLG